MSSSIIIKNSNGDFIDFKGRKSKSFNTSLGETTWNLPRDLGEGIFKNINFKSGLDVSFSSCRFKRNYHAQINHNTPKINFAFNLSGKTSTKNSCLKTAFLSQDEESYVHFFDDPLIKRETDASKDLKGLVIRISKEKFMELGEYENNGSLLPDLFLPDGNLKNFLTCQKMTPKMKAVLFEMINCRHKGAVKKIFLESKAFELIAYKIDQLSGTDSAHCPMSKNDRDKIYLARDILLKDIKTPPSLTFLAAKAGISHTKLNRGFREIFDCTVFEYLRNQRLLYAKSLLQENNMSITEIAFESGFCSSSHFASAFFKKFGIRPKDFRD